ncbi:hypothetical protein CBR_g21279 [Chara braunii]|uniref:Uncharacterized protein n=1 Tax=Chara braunii TaxID=69332 RepID=A0A388L165_CHABU|nr:hypothetical protein CBR_g21279 [Chara braunii]|eukprot:GBG76039.1 hypothetical protein CBR_g21279 [Chara braunii]
MKVFDVRGDGTELRMLTAKQFLSRMNGYRVTDCLPVVERCLELTKPLVKFSSPADQLPGVVKEYTEAFSRLPLDQQADCAFVPFVTSSRKSRQTPSAPVGKRKQLAACQAPPLPAASPSPLPSMRGGHDIAQCSSEATEYDDRNLYGRKAPRDSAREGATALTERNEEEEDGEAAVPGHVKTTVMTSIWTLGMRTCRTKTCLAMMTSVSRRSMAMVTSPPVLWERLLVGPCVLLLGRAHEGLVWEFLLAKNNVIACDESAKDIAYLTKFIDIPIKDDRFNCHVEKPRCKHRPNRDMFHKLGPKRLKVWEYLFCDMPQGRLDGKYIYRKAKATETLKYYHGALTSAFETIVARCEIHKFDLRKDQLTSKDYAELAKSGDGFNPVESEEDSSDSDLELGEDTCAKVPRGGMVQAHDDGTVHSHEGPIPVVAPSVASMVAPSETAALQDNGRCSGNEEDDIEIPGEASTLAPGDAIPPGYCADPNTIYFLEGKHTHTGEDQWGHDIIWHEGVLQPCIQDGEWKMAVKYTSGWKTFRRMSKDIWLKTTELAILHRVCVENPGQSEAAIKAKAEELFNVLRDNR